ncbi:MAG TPA: tRNA (adenosine(37)-N6)-threonylcarbamoyltransferase complex dimerization subunit type 1 TsaB [Alphaproteobacteria bacterium]
MRILGLDSATGGCSAAVWADGRILAYEAAPHGANATEAMVPMLDRVMARAGLDFEALDRLAVTNGPGHFTGMRAALAVVQGLALAVQRPVIPVTTLEAIAAGMAPDARRGHRVLAAIDSKRAEPFLQIFDADLVPLGPAIAMMADDFAAGAPDGAPFVVVGDAAEIITRALIARGRPATVADAPGRPDARVVAALAASRPATRDPVRPFYIHPPAARPLSPARSPA